MRVIQCPNCDNELVEKMVKIRGGQTQPEKKQWKLQCRICLHCWIANDADYYEQAPAQPETPAQAKTA